MATVKLSDVDFIVSKACNEQFKSFLHGNRIKFDSICLGGSIFAGAAGVADPKVMAFITGATVANLGNSVYKAYTDTLNFARHYRMQLLSQTPEYQECKRIYDNYVAKVGNFIYDLGVRDSLDIGMLYIEMLYNGYLSAPRTFKYHKFKIDYDMCSPLMGARVTSGGAVCRHIASNLRDIYKYLGIPSIYLAVSGTKSNISSAIIDRLLPHRPNHAVVMVGDNFGKYVIDPTWKTVAEVSDNDKFASIIYNRGEFPMYHIDIDGTIKTAKSYDYNDYIRMRLIDPVRFGRGEVKQSREYAKEFIRYNRWRFDNLSYRLGLDMQNIANLEHMLSGYGDTQQMTLEKRLLR